MLNPSAFINNFIIKIPKKNEKNLILEIIQLLIVVFHKKEELIVFIFY